MAPEIISPATSYDLTDRVRDLSEEFSAVLATSRGLLALIREESRDFYGADGKLEWLEDVEDFENDTLNTSSAPVLAADTTFVVSHVGRFSENMIIKFRDCDETMRITGIDTSLSLLAVVRSENGITAPDSIDDGSVIDILSRPVSEYNRAHEVAIWQPDSEYNFYETFREDLPFSEKIARSRRFGFSSGQDFINYNVERWMRRLRSRLNREIIWGERNSGTAAIPPRMRGVFAFLRQDGTNKTDGEGEELSASMVNNLLESIYLDDSNTGDLILFMDTVQARRMATFNSYVANRMETVAFDSLISAGNTAVTLFKGDLEPIGMPTIVVDKDAPKGAVMALNTGKLRLVYAPGGRLTEWDSKPADLPPDARRRGLIMTCSLMMKDHKYSHGLIYNLQKTLSV